MCTVKTCSTTVEQKFWCTNYVHLSENVEGEGSFYSGIMVSIRFMSSGENVVLSFKNDMEETSQTKGHRVQTKKGAMF